MSQTPTSNDDILIPLPLMLHPIPLNMGFKHKQEDEELFARTMSGVMKNVAHLCTRDRSKTWGKEGWKKVVVCIVSDGRSKVNSRTLSSIATIGCYQDGVAKVSAGEFLFIFFPRGVIDPFLNFRQNVVGGKPVVSYIHHFPWFLGSNSLLDGPFVRVHHPE